MRNFSAAEEIIGYSFKDKNLLKACFTHSSYLNEHPGSVCNERLEFLGDAVLELVCTERVYFSGDDEGKMTERRRRYVSDESLKSAVIKLGLDKFLLYSGGKSNVGKKAIPSLLEAIIGGIYLDGGYDAAKSFILRCVTSGGDKNYIGIAQEYFQSMGKDIPKYVLLSESGREDEKTFTVQVKTEIGSFIGTGQTKKAARMAAAKLLCGAINNI